MSGIRDRIKKTILAGTAVEVPSGREGFIRLDLNESSGVIDKSVISDFKNFGNFVISAYPEYDNLLNLLSEYVNIDKEYLCLFNGSDQAIEHILRIFFSEGSSVVVPAPTFFVYHHILRVAGAHEVIVLYKDKGETFSFPFEEVIDTLNSDVDGLLLCNPNNPLGSSIDEKHLQKLIERTAELGIPIIIDEAYFEFSRKSALRFVKTFKNVIVIRTLSKAFGLAGVRLGYAIADPLIIKELLKIQLPWNVNHFAAYAGVTALKKKSYFEEKLKEFNQVKAEFVKFLKDAGFQCYHSETNFITCRVKDAQALTDFLRKEKILIKNLSEMPSVNNILNNCVRITVPSGDNVEKVKRVIEDYGNR